MINSHAELVKEVLHWADKMELIKTAMYVTDIGNIDVEINKAQYRVFVFSPLGMDFSDNYNSSITYGFQILDKPSGANVKGVSNSETENIFCVSALNDYINHIKDGDITFGTMDLNTINTESGVVTSLSGTFSLNIKRTASYWKKMEEYSA